MTGKLSSADGVKWNLNDLFKGYDDPNLDKALKKVLADVQTFEKKYKGKLGKGMEPKEMLDVIRNYENLTVDFVKPLVFVELLFASDTSKPEHGAVLAKVREQVSVVRTHLLFVELEWCALDDKDADVFIRAPELEKYSNFLKSQRRFKPHKLSEPEERLLEMMSNTGKRAFVRLFDETVNSMEIEVTVDGETKKMPLESGLSLLHHPERKRREAANKAITNGLKPNAKLVTYILNTIAQDHFVEDKMRRFPNMMSERNLQNEVDGKVVQILLEASKKNVQMVARYYNLKRKLLGLDKLYDYDRYAPVGVDLPRCDYLTGKAMTLEAYESFSPRMRDMAQEFFDKNWIDAELRPGKEGGAFCAGTTPDMHPYVKLNYTDQLGDVMTMAHELGHGIHGHLSQKQGMLQMDTSLAVAETASVFGEMLVFRMMMEREKDPKVRLALLCSKIEDSFATAFRQTMMTEFESRVHAARRDKGEQKVETYNQYWMEVNEAMFVGSVELTEGYAWWWTYVLHFFHYHFYTYAYAFGEILVLSLYAKYQKEGKPFTDKYIEMLESGSSVPPRELVAKVGVDLEDPMFWQNGFDLIGQMVADAERLAKEIGG
ncbi:MAG: M3 family oligoendopeptidase [Euryarchaeota archaeon]|nr:M3 family oligoendopeptidase [Euryarchaeota archaeon]